MHDANTSRTILGFVGPMASGKGTACRYLQEKHGAATVRYSTMLRDVLSRLYLPHTRDNLIKLSETLRATYGDDLLATVIRKEVESTETTVVAIDGIRRPQDIQTLRDLPGFRLVHITADQKIRHARMVSRGENTDDTTKTLEQFIADEARSTEQTIATVAQQADVVIDNNGSLETLYAQLDQLVH